MDQLPLSFGKSAEKPKQAEEQARKSRIAQSKRQNGPATAPVASSSKTAGEAQASSGGNDQIAEQPSENDEEEDEDGEGSGAPDLPATHEVILKDHTKVRRQSASSIRNLNLYTSPSPAS